MDEKTIKLIESAINGDENALDELYNLSYQKIFFYCLGIMKNREEAMDLTQETFIEIFKSIKNLKEAKAFKSWAYRIAYNLAHKKWDKQKKDFVLVSEDAENYLEEVPEFNETALPEDKVQLQATKDIIKSFIEKLPEKQKAVVMLYYYEKMSTTEIAEAMDCSENTVKSRLNYARAKIKLEVEAEERRGVKLYVVSIPVLLLSLEEMANDSKLSVEEGQALFENIKESINQYNLNNSSSKSNKLATKKSTFVAKILASKKALIAIIAMLAGGGCISAYVINRQKAEENVEVSQAEEAKENNQENSGENTAEVTENAGEEEKQEEYVDYNKVYKTFFDNREENITKLFPDMGMEGEETVKGIVLDYNNDGKAEFIVSCSYVYNDKIMNNLNLIYYLKYENGSVVRDMDKYTDEEGNFEEGVLGNIHSDEENVDCYVNYYIADDGEVYEFWKYNGNIDPDSPDSITYDNKQFLILFNGSKSTEYDITSKTDFTGKNGQPYSKIILKDGSEKTLRKVELEPKNAYEINFDDEFWNK